MFRTTTVQSLEDRSVPENVSDLIEDRGTSKPTGACNGTTKWPSAKELRTIGETRAASTPSKVKEIFARIGEAMSHTTGEIRRYIKEHPGFSNIGRRMLQEWEEGMALSLGLAS